MGAGRMQAVFQLTGSMFRLTGNQLFGVTRHAGSIFGQILTSWRAFVELMVFLGVSQHADSDFDIRFL